MTSDILSGNWKQLSGEIQKQWSKFTDEDLGKIGGYKDKLLGALQEKYGYAKNKAEEELEKFMEKHEIDLMDLKEKATKVVQEFPQQLEECVQENPFKSLLLAVGAGLVLGALFLRA
jgi:uncharacterized protein YjbJ (UPF0337 family)